LMEVLRQGAREMLAAAIEEEARSYVAAWRHERDEAGRQLVTLNGHGRERQLQTGLGPIPVRPRRVHDRRAGPDGERCRFQSRLLPPYLRRTKNLEELIPWLYLKGVSTGDMSEALVALLGPGAAGLSASSVVRLKERWEADYEAWCHRRLDDRRYVYLWVDGIYCNVRLEEDNACILVVIGATADGRKELLAVHDGVRESEQSWRGVLLDLKARGLKEALELAVGDGALGFWKALRKVYPRTRGQRCWVHKTANVLNYLPRRLQAEAKARLHAIWMAPTRAEAERAFDVFVETYEAKYPKASRCGVCQRL